MNMIKFWNLWIQGCLVSGCNGTAPFFDGSYFTCDAKEEFKAEHRFCNEHAFNPPLFCPLMHHNGKRITEQRRKKVEPPKKLQTVS